MGAPETSFGRGRGCFLDAWKCGLVPEAWSVTSTTRLISGHGFGDGNLHALTERHRSQATPLAPTRQPQVGLWVPKTRSGALTRTLGSGSPAPGEVLRGSLTSWLRAIKSQPEVEGLESSPHVWPSRHPCLHYAGRLA